MKIIVDDEYIQKLIESYERLGFKFHDEDLCNFIMNDKETETFTDYYKFVRVSFNNEKHETITKTIGDLRITDLNAAYIYSNDIAKSKKQRLINGEAFNNLIYLSAKSDTRTKINKMIIKNILEKNNLDIIDTEAKPVEVVEEKTVEKKSSKKAQNNNVRYELQTVPVNEIVKKDDTKCEITKAPTTEVVKKDDTKHEIKSAEVRNTELCNPTRAKIIKIEEDKETADKARSIINKDSILVTAGLIILAGAIGFAGYACTRTGNTTRSNNVATEETTDIYNDVNINNTNTNNVDNDNNNSVEEEIVPEPTKEPEIEETPVEENTEEVVEETQEEVNVHSEEYINDVVDNTLTAIQLNTDNNISIKYDRDLVDALVRYTHHNYEEYTGESKLSNEIAYEDLSELINHGFDISMFYKGLNNYENLKALYNATRNLKQEKGNYEDEFKIYMCMDVIMNDMDQKNFAEAVALRAYVDNYSVIPSMQMARQQAGVLEMKDTQDLWKDVNKDGKITYEENAEGKGYNDEKAAAIAAKYGEMDSQKCAQIYNRISTDNHNSELTQIVYKALDEDDARARTR